MNRIRNSRILKAALPVSLLALGAAVVPGCSGTDDLTACEFQAQIDAVGSALASLEAVAGEMRVELAGACAAIAGNDTFDAASATDDDVTEQCNAASAAIDAEFAAAGTVTLDVQPGKCVINASAQIDCEGSCAVDAECDPGGVEARCTPGELTVACDAECEGTATCEGSASVSVACEGECTGTCSGTCTGTCDGQCEGTCSAENADGSCAGECDGTCEGTCSASCEGTCSGSCTYDADATATCDAELRCEGECTGTATAPECEAELDPPSCEMDADCQAGCSGQANLDAECTPPSIVLTGDLDAEFAANLKANLPVVLEVLGKAELALKSAVAVAEASANVLVKVGDAPTCAASIAGSFTAQAEGAVAASASVSVSASASADVSGSASSG